MGRPSPTRGHRAEKTARLPRFAGAAGSESYTPGALGLRHASFHRRFLAVDDARSRKMRPR